MKAGLNSSQHKKWVVWRKIIKANTQNVKLLICIFIPHILYLGVFLCLVEMKNILSDTKILSNAKRVFILKIRILAIGGIYYSININTLNITLLTLLSNYSSYILSLRRRGFETHRMWPNFNYQNKKSCTETISG